MDAENSALSSIYTGPENMPAQHGYRNLFDTTILLTPNLKFNAYINYDFGMNKDSISQGLGNHITNKWQGIAGAARRQITPKIAAAGRLEILDDMNGYTTGTKQTVKEYTATGEYLWARRLLARMEYRHDWSDVGTFHKGSNDMVDSQSTVTLGLVAIFAPNR